MDESNNHRRSPKGTHRVAFILFLVFLLLYSLLPTKNFNYADDSLRWAYELTRSGNLINSHHLYLNVMRFFYRLFRDLGLPVDPARLLCLYSAFWGALGLAFLYMLLQRAGFGSEALLSTLLCAFTAGYWSYSIVGDVYLPSIALLVMGIYFTVGAVDSTAGTTVRTSATLAVGSFGLMLLHHQAMFVFVIGLLPAILMMTNTSVRRRTVLAVGIPSGVALMAAGAYGAAYLLGTRPGAREGFLRFCAGYVASFDARPDQKQLGVGTLLNTGAGEVRALVSTNVIFRNMDVALAVQQRYPTRAVYPFPFLVHSLPVWVAVAVGMASAVSVLLILFLFVRGLWSGLRDRGLVTLIFIPAMVQLLFFMWWEGISDEFCLWTLPLIAICVASGAATLRRTSRWLGTLCGLLAVSTFSGSIVLFWNPKYDVDLVNDSYARSLGPGDVLVGFEDIQSAHRIKLWAEDQGFEYVNIRDSAPKWSQREELQTLSLLDSAAREGSQIYVSPRLSFPPKNALAFMRYLNPKFDVGWASLLEGLKRRPSIHWLRPAVFLDHFFYSASGYKANP